jgi:hypothetical protein
VNAKARMTYLLRLGIKREPRGRFCRRTGVRVFAVMSADGRRFLVQHNGKVAHP